MGDTVDIWIDRSAIETDVDVDGRRSVLRIRTAGKPKTRGADETKYRASGYFEHM